MSQHSLIQNSLILSLFPSGKYFVKNAFNELTAAETVPDLHRYSLFKLPVIYGLLTLEDKSRKKDDVKVINEVLVKL